MQTRRKSLNLGDLGVIAPKRARTASHPSPPATVLEGEEPPIKKSKRSHGPDSPSPSPMSPPRTTSIRFKDERPKTLTELSPPPSPVAEGSNKVDTEGINDDIVVASIQQLEKTGNRPHLVKELAAVLATNLQSVEKSANPCALISSRLTAYLHRSWPAISPCPLAKDLSPVHPRRLYFFLTTSPHQPIPETVEPPPKANRIISPSLSSASAADEEDRFVRDRHALSPSPEVDLSSPELDPSPVDAPGASFSSSSSRARDRAHYSRRASPPLETEERDFKQTASALHEQAQRNSFSASSQQDDVNMDAVSGAERDAPADDDVAPSIESEERKNSEAAVALFGGVAEHFSKADAPMEFSSPLLQPQERVSGSLSAAGDVEPNKTATFDHRYDEAMHLDGADDEHTQFAAAFELDDSLQSPEKVEMAELEDMFDSY